MIEGLKSRLRSTLEILKAQYQRLWLSRRYTAVHGNFDRDIHVHEALQWLIRAQDSGDDDGVAYGARFGEGFLPSYPETTGYIIPTFLALADDRCDSDLENRAVRMGDWETKVQLSCGAVMAGKVTASPNPAVFNTGQVLLGWCALFRRTGALRFADAARRAGDWLVSAQDEDGNWSRGNSPLANPDATLYNVRAAWGLARAGADLGVGHFIDAAMRNASYALGYQRQNGWFARCCLTDPVIPLTHTLAYAARGFFELGVLTSEERFVSAARRTADAVTNVVDGTGYLAGRVDQEWKGVVRWSCLTGSAQFAILLSKLYRHTGKENYGRTARALNRYVMARHDITSADPTIRGGLAGSWPVSGDYGRFMVLNWATKFHIDALLEEKINER